jgi:chromatin remodeling complex protein RSC6
MPPKKQTEAKAPAAPAKKAAAKKAPVQKSAPAPAVAAPEPVKVDEVAVEEPTDTTVTEFVEFTNRLSALRTQCSNLLQDFKSLQKKVERELKAAQKAGQKRKRKTGARQPSGFVKPTLISDDLAVFLGKPKGSELARTEVTREINAYIREHKLQDPANGRKINPDDKLKKLLSIKPSDELTYFNLQRYMSPHFQKAGQAPISTSA